MKKLPYRVGIAGYGVVGKRRHQFIDLQPELQVHAVCDQNPDQLAGATSGIKIYSSYSELLTEDLDVLFVCLSNDVAAETTIAGLQAGFHVFCEKPPGQRVSEVLAVKEVAQRYPHQKLKYGFNHRYHESVKQAISLVDSGELGRLLNLRGVYGKPAIVNFESNWRTERKIAGGGILLDQGIHMVDLLRLFGGEFMEYHSFVSNDFWKHDVEDNAYALMRSETGVVALFQSSATMWRPSFELDITLSEGSIHLSGILSGSKSYGEETMTIIRRSTEVGVLPREEMMRFHQDNSWEEEIREFAQAISRDAAITSGSIDDALQTMETVYRIYQADHEWKAKWNL